MAAAVRPEVSATRLAVLPFANISPDPEHAYFADGLTEELISTLSQISGLRVIARTSAMRYRSTSLSVAGIARELGVRTVLEGSVRRQGNAVRVSVKLISAETEEHLWAQTYDRELSDIFEIQSDIAKRVARSLRVRLARPEARRLEHPATSDVGAYTLYLQGRFEWNRRTDASLRTAVDRFRQALAKDPGFALAESGLADAFATLALLEFVPPTEAFPRARAAAERAIALDDRLAEAHASLGLVRFQYDRDWSGAEAEFRTAIALNPNYAAGHQFFADYLKAMGRFPEALEQMARALELDPLSMAINTGLGHVLYLARQYERAIDQYRRSLEIDPAFATAHLWFGRPFLETGRFEEAIREVERAVELTNGSTMALAVLAHTLASAGRASEARKILGQLLARAATSYLPSYWIALVHTGLGDKDEALRWLDRACEERSSWLAWVKVEPRFDLLRDDPRFAALLRRMRLDQTPTGPDDPARRIQAYLAAATELRVADYRVAGAYARFDGTIRHRLKDFRQRVAAALANPSERHDNFLLWGAPGSGKTFLVRETSRTVSTAHRYVELNLAEAGDAVFRAALDGIARSTEPMVVLVDEADAHPGEAWPYEAMLPLMDASLPGRVGRVVVLAGSSGSDLESMVTGIRARPKGADLVSRIPEGNLFSIPPVEPEDRLLVSVSTLLQSAAASGRTVEEIEKLALYFIASHPALANARKLREFALRCGERVPPGESRVKYDHLFDPGDPENKRFWTGAAERAPELIGSYVRVRA